MAQAENQRLISEVRVKFDISHTIRYAYSRPVSLQPHTLHFFPRNGDCQRVQSCQITVDPEPSLMSHHFDAEGNVATSVWFRGEWARLSVTARSRVLTTRVNPFDYLVPLRQTLLPMSYGPPLANLLEPARKRGATPRGDDPVKSLANELCHETDFEVLPFLTTLTEKLFVQFKTVRRRDGGPRLPAETWRRRKGACRDLAVLFIDVCRVVGLAARFVSGYKEGDPEESERDPHAWAEVFVPGGGWRGYDPTTGLAVADRHVVVAAAVNPGDTTPVSGSYCGTGATALMESELEIRVGCAERVLAPQNQAQKSHQH